MGFERTLVAGLCFGVLSVISVQADPSDIYSYETIKKLDWKQTSTATPVFVAATFYAELQATTATSVNNPTIIQPGGSSNIPLIYQGSNFWLYQDQYLTRAAMDAVYPDGGFTFTIPTTSGSALTYTPTLNQLSNYATGSNPIKLNNTDWNASGSLTLDYSVSNTLTWGPNSETDQVSFQGYGNLGDNFSYGIAPGSTSLLIPALTFQNGEIFDVFMQETNTTTDTTSIPGVPGYVQAVSNLYFRVQAIPEPSTTALLMAAALGGFLLRRRRI